MTNGFFVLWAIVAFIIAIGILVTVHEFGHFWVARRCGIKVHAFSIGFGKQLWSFVDKKGTQFSISLIPLGGYVRMLDSRVEQVALEDQQYDFIKKSILKRAAVIAAGPIANFIFAILVYWIIYMIGVPTVSPIVGHITVNSIAQQARVPENIELKSIAGIKVKDWATARLAVIEQIGNNSLALGYRLLDDNKIESRQLNITGWRVDLEHQDPIVALGLEPKPLTVLPILSQVSAQSPAEKAGLRVGDEIIAINDKPFESWDKLVNIIRQNPKVVLTFSIKRDNTTKYVDIYVESKQNNKGQLVGFVGIAPTLPQLNLVRYNPLESIWMAAKQTAFLIKLTAKSVVQLVTGVFDLSNLSGPISIAKGAGESASYGLVPYLTFLAFISISLGIMNLLPLPVLDGGHLLFLIIEKIRGKPLSEKIQAIWFQLGIIVLILLMGLALFNDFSRL